MDFNDDACAACAEALVAGTVALMTTWADPCPRSSLEPARQRALMARKIVSNLFFLSRHPALSAELRQVMAMAHERWAGLTRRADQGRVVEPPAPIDRAATVH